MRKAKKPKRFVAAIAAMDPCPEAIVWLSGRRSPADAWRMCRKSGWLLWMLGRAGYLCDRSKVKRLAAAMRVAMMLVENRALKPSAEFPMDYRRHADLLEAARCRAIRRLYPAPARVMKMGRKPKRDDQ